MSNDETAMEMQIKLDKETTDKIAKMTKAEMLEGYCVLAVEAKASEIQLQELEKELISAQTEVRTLRTKLDKCEAYCEQGRAMIEAVMERWYKYDV